MLEKQDNTGKMQPSGHSDGVREVQRLYQEYNASIALASIDADYDAIERAVRLPNEIRSTNFKDRFRFMQQIKDPYGREIFYKNFVEDRKSLSGKHKDDGRFLDFDIWRYTGDLYSKLELFYDAVHVSHLTGKIDETIMKELLETASYLRRSSDAIAEPLFEMLYNEAFREYKAHNKKQAEQYWKMADMLSALRANRKWDGNPADFIRAIVNDYVEHSDNEYSLHDVSDDESFDETLEKVVRSGLSRFDKLGKSYDQFYIASFEVGEATELQDIQQVKRMLESEILGMPEDKLRNYHDSLSTIIDLAMKEKYIDDALALQRYADFFAAKFLNNNADKAK